MNQEDTIKFHKPSDQNDINIVESLISPTFLKKNIEYKHYWNQIRLLLLSAMKYAKVNRFKRNIFWCYVNRTITKGLEKSIPLLKVEDTLRKFIRRHVNVEKDQKSQEFKHTKTRFETIKQYIVRNKILDLGAGNGLLALEIKEQLNKEVVLVDILDYNYTDLSLIL